VPIVAAPRARLSTLPISQIGGKSVKLPFFAAQKEI
jgi:hypothetical protein